MSKVRIEPAHPTRVHNQWGGETPCPGLSKKEWIAAHALQSLILITEQGGDPSIIANRALVLSNALIDLIREEEATIASAPPVDEI